MGEFSGKDLYQIKITLVDSKPPVWRRLIVPKTIPLDELHMVIQLAMGWTNSHMYSFEKGNLAYGMIVDDHKDPCFQDSTGVPLIKLLRKKGEKIVYVYDFGDNWDHCILLEESSLTDQKLPHIPICIKGAETCPTEDSGGVWGYYQMLEDIQDVNNPEREELHAWLMDDIAERTYDLKNINQRLIDFYS
ncbi:plasmid pRiA4b ORF-3 family protein [Sodalis sp. (in: enterobacteria)]|uniref:plasmid pRiA4b ORF-3 family protein n=1 Tax=Sodalis sp. (in: enterobacteria) TaxID=1898979 RepID=UPI003F35F83D